MAAHRYWRVLGVSIYNNTGSAAASNEWSASTLEFYDADLQPLIKGVTSGAIGTTPSEGSLAGAFDYNRDSRWTCNNSGTKWLGYDFGSGVTKDVRGFRWANRNDSFAFQSFKDYSLQYSDDGTTWTTAWSGTETHTWPSFTTRYYFDPARPYVTPAGAHRFWRVHVTALSANATDTTLSASEIEFLDSADNPLVQGNPTSYRMSGFNAGSPPENAYDGSLTTFWASPSGMPQWAGYDFGEYRAVAVARFRWSNRRTSNFHQAPAAGKLQYSDDGTTWTDSFSFTDSVNWTTADTRTYPASSATARPQVFVCT